MDLWAEKFILKIRLQEVLVVTKKKIFKSIYIFPAMRMRILPGPRAEF